MRQLPRQRRLCFSLTGSCSNTRRLRLTCPHEQGLRQYIEPKIGISRYDDENAKCSGQISSLRPAVSQHHAAIHNTFKSPTPSHLTLAAPDFLSRGEPMEKCGYWSEIACSARGYFCSTVVNLTMRTVDLTGSRAGA